MSKERGTMYRVEWESKDGKISLRVEVQAVDATDAIKLGLECAGSRVDGLTLVSAERYSRGIRDI